MQRVSFVLVPGVGGDAWIWHLVASQLRERGHEAIPVDLPAADHRAGLAEYADTVVRAIGGRDPSRVVVVAQSLGGFTAPLVCERVPVGLLVLVNAMIPNSGETPGEWFAHTHHAEAKRRQDLRDGRAPDAPFDLRAEFFHDVPQAVIDAAWARGEPRQADTVFGSRCAFAAWPAKPIRVLVGRDDRFFPADFQRRVAKERLGVSADEMPGGHLAALSQPGELTARLIAYAEQSLPGV